MELQQKLIDDFIDEYRKATRSEKREAVMTRALFTLDAKSMLNFLSLAIHHLEKVRRESEFDE